MLTTKGSTLVPMKYQVVFILLMPQAKRNLSDPKRLLPEHQKLRQVLT